jgi:hypothetical protein
MDTEDPHKEIGYRRENSTYAMPSYPLLEHHVSFSRLKRTEFTHVSNQMLTIDTALVWVKIALKLTLFI